MRGDTDGGTWTARRRFRYAVAELAEDSDLYALVNSLATEATQEGPSGAKHSSQRPVPIVTSLRSHRCRRCGCAVFGLQGVGPDGARFDLLDLDFATEDGAASRVLLSLTNTGGKSTLITLLCSVVVPASRAQVGGKVLGDYVLTGDTSHVVCEWEDSTSDVRIVTGTVMEWRDGRRQPAHTLRSTTNMHRAWYLFRTGLGLPGIDDLPFLMDGRRCYVAAPPRLTTAFAPLVGEAFAAEVAKESPKCRAISTWRPMCSAITHAAALPIASPARRGRDGDHRRNTDQQGGAGAQQHRNPGGSTRALTCAARPRRRRRRA